MSNGRESPSTPRERAWDTRRRILEETVIAATIDLFGHTASQAFRLPIPNTTPPLFVTAGDLLEVKERTAQIAAHRACCGTEHDPANGKLHGCCIVCGVAWPCEYAGKAPVSEKRENLLPGLGHAQYILRLNGFDKAAKALQFQIDTLAALQQQAAPERCRHSVLKGDHCWECEERKS